MYEIIKYVINKIKFKNETLNTNAVIKNLLFHTDKNKTILQGKYLRDNIGLCKILNLFINLIKMEIICETWKFHDIFEKKEFEKKDEIILNLNVFLQNKIKSLNEYGFYVILLEIPYHINLIFIDKRKKYKWKYYFYEPHMPEKYNEKYEFIKYVNNFFVSNGYVLSELPKYILQQNELPICYIYVLHSMLYLYASHNNIEINTEFENNSDTYISNFTEKLLSVCYNNKLIKDTDYFILTDYIEKINKIICYDDVLLLSCNPNIIVSMFENNNNLHITYINIHNLYDEGLNLNYFDDVICLISKSENISIQQKNEFYVLELLLKYVYNVNITNSLYEYYDEDIFYNIIYDENIIAIYNENYLFCLKIFNMIKNVYRIRNIIYKEYSFGELYDMIKKNENKKMLNLIDRKINQKRKRE